MISCVWFCFCLRSENRVEVEASHQMDLLSHSKFVLFMSRFFVFFFFSSAAHILNLCIAFLGRVREKAKFTMTLSVQTSHRVVFSDEFGEITHFVSVVTLTPDADSTADDSLRQCIAHRDHYQEQLMTECVQFVC